ncbi:hypothetical protein Esti_005970 [Eimeria stiedai]
MLLAWPYSSETDALNQLLAQNIQERCPGNMRLRGTKTACCALVGLSWVPLCLLAGGGVVTSGSEFLPWNSRAEVLSETVATPTVTVEQTSMALENIERRWLPFNSDITDETITEPEDRATRANIENAGKYPKTLGTPQKFSHRSRFLTGLGVSIVLAVCLGVLALHWKGRPSPQVVEESHIQQSGRVREKLSSRLKALRALVPVAEQLGKAVNTAEACELLKAVHANVPKDGEEEGEGSAKLENALNAMRMLQQAALKEAGLILQKDLDNLSSVTSFLEESKKAYFTEEETNVLSPFITALTLSHKHFLQTSQQMRKVYERLEQAHPLGDEQDVNSLLHTTHGLHFVLNLQKDRENAALLATEQRTMAEAAMRMTLYRETLQGFRRRWGEFEIAQAYLNMKREAGGAAEGESDAELQGHLDEAELRLQKHVEELKQLMKHAHSETYEDLSGTVARTIAIEQAQEALGTSLANHWDLFNEHVQIPEKLDNFGRECVKTVLNQALQSTLNDRNAMDLAITTTLLKMAEVFCDPETQNQTAMLRSGVHDILQRHMTSTTLKFIGQRERRLTQLQSWLQSVDQEEDTSAAAKMMRDAVAAAVQSFDELTDARLALLRINLLISVEITARCMMGEATEASEGLKSFLFSGFLEPTEQEILLDTASELEDLRDPPAQRLDGEKSRDS